MSTGQFYGVNATGGSGSGYTNGGAGGVSGRCRVAFDSVKVVLLNVSRCGLVAEVK